ncbi:response regulator [Myxococcaceae bacterium GXIMD 01537]
MNTVARPRVLAVEVESGGFDRVRSILAPAGYDVLPAAGTAEALEAVAQDAADLVLLDVSRHGDEGIAACRQIRQELGRPSLPILMLTPATDREARRRALAAGVDDLLTKPLDPDELKVRVHTLLELKAHREQDARGEEQVDPRARWLQMERLARLGTLAADVAEQFGQIGNDFQRGLEHVRARAAQGLPPDTEVLKKLGVAGEQLRLHGQHLLALGQPSPKDIQRCDLRELARTVVERMQAEGRLGHTEVRFHVPEEPVRLTVNRRQLDAVLVQLVANAADALEHVRDRARVVRLIVEAADDFGDWGPRILVQDTGIGIFPDELQAIFEPYYTTKPPEKGAGLGLTVARTLVESMGGELTVRSRVNLGSTFSVELPEPLVSW